MTHETSLLITNITAPKTKNSTQSQYSFPNFPNKDHPIAIVICAKSFLFEINLL